MNLILFHPQELETEQLLSDPRSLHILEVLRRSERQDFDVGLINGPRGKATLIKKTLSGLHFSFSWEDTLPEVEQISLIVGLARPQTARKVLREATTIGIHMIHFVSAEKSDPSYAHSKLWSTGEYRRHLIAGAEQAFTTQIPQISYQGNLEEAIELSSAHQTKIALDNYEATSAFSTRTLVPKIILALGPERGWSNSERELLRSSGYELCHLGSRVLRTETASSAA
ncbi:MAG: RNA methyltransferase, partial [Opitutaceae bacterium]|nr:RNA methyltransferase [Opitutaceae bacterium]